jgi:zinc protease
VRPRRRHMAARLTPALLAALLLAGAGAAIGAARVADAQTLRDREWPASTPPRPLPAKDVRFPPYQIRTLANGLRVVAVSHHEQPAVSVRMLVGAGSAQDPPGKLGLANLLASLLDQGTTTRSAGDIADLIDTIGGRLGTGAGTDLSFVNIVVMKDSFPLALELLSDLVRNPAFAPEEIERQREQVLSGLQVSYQDPGYVADAVIDRLVFGFHPYGLPGDGTPASVAAITRDDLVAFHRSWFLPNNAILAVAGDVTAEEAFAGVERIFGAWPRGELPRLADAQPPDPTRRVVVVDRPGAVQTEIRAGNLTIPRKHADYTALDLVGRVLGGEGANRLQRVLRSERGLTYGASVDLKALKRAGAIVAETNTRSDATGEALRVTVDEFFRVQRERVHPLELADAQAYLTGSFALRIETPDAVAMQLLTALFYDIDVKEVETLRERVNAVTADDLQRAARAYLHPARLSIVLVGDARTIGPQLKAAGFPEFEQVSVDELDLTAADLRKGGSRAPAAGRDEP